MLETLAIILAVLYVVLTISTISEWNRVGKPRYSTAHKLLSTMFECVSIAIILIILI